MKALKNIVQQYEPASGQKINCQKSAITFSSKASQELKDIFKGELDISKEGGAGKYIGLPEHFGTRKKDLFSLIVDRIK